VSVGKWKVVILFHILGSCVKKYRLETLVVICVPTGSSERLRFEPLSPAHASVLSEALLDPAVYAFIGGRHPTTTEDLTSQFEHFVKGPPANRSAERWWNVAVFSADGNHGLGRLEATIIENRAEIAYLFGPKYWGKGYALEALRWFQNRLAEECAVSKFWATVLPGNERSVRLLQRLGYARVAGDWPDLGSYAEGDLLFCRQL
jgi:RimJ/RimL family protein N-acetyltransferase